MSQTHTLRLGPLSFRTTADSGPTEALGNAIEVVGAALTSADPAPKPFTLVVPVGFAGRADREEGLLLRQQVRALLNNAPARMQGLHFSWSVDPELDAWLIVGGGDLEPADGASGVVAGEWRLTLRDCYVAGRRRTHREALLVRVEDRRLETSARDRLGRISRLRDFQGIRGASDIALPAGAHDVLVSGVDPSYATIETADGPLTIAEGVEHNQVISFERADAGSDATDVRILDRRGGAPEDEWIAVYGPDHELTAGDAPVLANAIARVRWNAGALVLSVFDGGGWVERGRIPLGQLVAAHVAEWTPARAVVGLVAIDAPGQRVVAYVTLQRGWTGPQVELYAPTARLRYVSATPGSVVYRHPTAGAELAIAGSPLPAGTVASFAGANWIELRHGGSADALAVTVRDVATVRGSDLGAYGSARSFAELTAPVYAGARFALARAPTPSLSDDFSTDTIASYVHSGSPVAIRNGVLTVTALQNTQLFHSASEGMDALAAVKVNVGASVTAWLLRLMVRWPGGSSYIAVQVYNGGKLEVFAWDRGVVTYLATGTANAIPNRAHWLVLKTDGPFLEAQWWNSDPTAPGEPVRVKHTLSAGQLATFPGGRGRSGLLFLPGGLDWTYDDLRFGGPGAAAELARHTMMDVRPQPTLVARN